MIARLAGRAREGGLQLSGEGTLLAQLTKRLVESALEGEVTKLNSRVIIEQAKGVLAKRGHLSMDAAFDLLRRYARQHNLRLSDLTRELIETDLAAAELLAVRNDEMPRPSKGHGRR